MMVNDPKPTLWERLTRPSMPLRMAYYFVVWVSLLVVLGLLMSDPGCSGEGVPFP